MQSEQLHAAACVTQRLSGHAMADGSPAQVTVTALQLLVSSPAWNQYVSFNVFGTKTVVAVPLFVGQPAWNRWWMLVCCLPKHGVTPCLFLKHTRCHPMPVPTAHKHPPPISGWLTSTQQCWSATAGKACCSCWNRTVLGVSSTGCATYSRLANELCNL
jgi:hypothetical protein